MESFQGDNAPGSKAFVRGGTINPNERVKTDSEGQCPRALYFEVHCLYSLKFLFAFYYI